MDYLPELSAPAIGIRRSLCFGYRLRFGKTPKTKDDYFG
jgi:hypothetical protein